MLTIHNTKNLKETQKIAQNFAKDILKKGLAKKAVFLALSGDLGAGKTTFLQGFAKGLGIKEKILSPTFVIQKRFSIKKSQFKNFYHIDCYRVEGVKDMVQISFKEYINNPENIIAVEWPERISKILPKNIIKIKLQNLKQNYRKIEIKW